MLVVRVSGLLVPPARRCYVVAKILSDATSYPPQPPVPRGNELVAGWIGGVRPESHLFDTGVENICALPCRFLVPLLGTFAF